MPAALCWHFLPGRRRRPLNPPICNGSLTALIYFGYPQAHEDDAERAVRAGLTLIEAVGKLHAREPLQVRIGVATGLVVVGDLVGSGEAQERGVAGETPNLAARLQGSPLQIGWSSPRARGGFSVIFSSCRTSAHRGGGSAIPWCIPTV
jgi:hypothetical protein